jgi:NTP pyrophosphatase (non-canonical NTP hydrolase)
MTLNEYQILAKKTAQYPEEYQIIYPTLGLTGEAGEVADKVKKVIRDKGSVFSNTCNEEIAKEIGDVLWYLAMLSYDLGYSLEEIAKMNIEKLYSRKERDQIKGNGDNR